MTFLYTNIWGECSGFSGWEWQTTCLHQPFFVLNWYARAVAPLDKAVFDRWAHKSTIECMQFSTATILWKLPIADLLRSGPRFEEGVEDRWKAADPIVLGSHDQLRLRLEGIWTESPVFPGERDTIAFHLEGLRFMGDQEAWNKVARHFFSRWKTNKDDVAERIAMWLESAHPDFTPLADGIREGRWKTTPIARRS